VIRIKRPAQVPPSLNSDAVRTSLDTIRAIADKGKPASNQFARHWGKEDVRHALWQMQLGKCAYCERKREEKRESDIEHFRPRAEVSKAPQHKGYWWLAYSWTNLFFSCRSCNQDYKRNWFPVLDEAMRAGNEKADLNQEKAYLIDPCEDEPETFLGCRREMGNLPFVRIIALPEDDWDHARARETIKVLGLDRRQLQEGRGSLLDLLDGLVRAIKHAQQRQNFRAIDLIAAQIRDATRSDLEFTGFRRDFFRQAGLGQYVNNN
jgi:uncharacterized protein (TIGR02646 family)